MPLSAMYSNQPKSVKSSYQNVRKALVKGQLGDIKFQVNPSTIQDEGGRVWFNIESAGMRPIPVSSGWKPRTLSFELLFHNNIMIDTDIADILHKLKVYRNSVERLTFVFGGAYTVECWLIECPLNIESFYWDLSVTSVRVPITIQLKEI